MIKIGVTGLFCSGKDTVASYLKGKGFEHISLSDLIREEATARGMDHSRDTLYKLGNELRAQHGKSVLAKKAMQKMRDDKKYIITSIRNPLEVKELANAKQFVLLKVESPVETRFNRLINRKERKDSDPKTFEEFVASEAREMSSANESGQQIQACMEMARFSIGNEGDVASFYKRIDELLPILENAVSYIRPSWDEYFMELALTVGKRGTCNRGRSGAIVVKDKRVVTTGYVGSPAGLAHCDEVGHWFKRTIHEDGSVTQHCIRTVHAEANAIAQAARHGISIEGGTLYCNMEPCIDCTKLLISSGIKRVVCNKRYQAAKESREMLEEAGVKLEVLNDELESYAEQKS